MQTRLPPRLTFRLGRSRACCRGSWEGSRVRAVQVNVKTSLVRVIGVHVAVVMVMVAVLLRMRQHVAEFPEAQSRKGGTR
ncbi:MAG: hypothetical protein JWP47_2667 [Polaromonas sp.]|jgi:hypothetical protein|nr:hypothetical protein [Polaromonas sp.]